MARHSDEDLNRMIETVRTGSVPTPTEAFEAWWNGVATSPPHSSQLVQEGMQYVKDFGKEAWLAAYTAGQRAAQMPDDVPVIKDRLCPHCHAPIEVRNPTGYCDHLYYPDYCDECRRRATPPDHQEGRG